MNFNRPLILASSSPRRQYLMREAGFQFAVEKPEGDESFPPELPIEQVAKYLALKKAETFRKEIHQEVVVTADTVVILDQKIINKPASREEAIQMLSSLSGRAHLVMTGVCILSAGKEESFDDTTEVTFRNLTSSEIEHYVDTYQPYDKAGAYGAQDFLSAGVNPCSVEEIQFIKMIGRENLIEESRGAQAGIGINAIAKINGSYFNVMGLPIHRVYEHLKNW